MEPRRQTVVLIHGIRTEADWQDMVVAKLQEAGKIEVIPIKYGYFDAIRFWFPVWSRRQPIARVTEQIRILQSKSSDNELTVIAHSFGTYILGHILRRCADIKIDRIILCGSVLPQNFPWGEVAHRRIKDGNIVNECGKRDIWPLLARSASWGYGSSGTHGFGDVLVKDRFHNYQHSEYFDEKFVEKYWVSLIREGKFVQSDWAAQRPTTPWWASVLPLLPLRWVIPPVALLVIAILILSLLRWINPAWITNISLVAVASASLLWLVKKPILWLGIVAIAAMCLLVVWLGTRKGNNSIPIKSQQSSVLSIAGMDFIDQKDREDISTVLKVTLRNRSSEAVVLNRAAMRIKRVVQLYPETPRGAIAMSIPLERLDEIDRHLKSNDLVVEFNQNMLDKTKSKVFPLASLVIEPGNVKSFVFHIYKQINFEPSVFDNVITCDISFVSDEHKQTLFTREFAFPSFQGGVRKPDLEQCVADWLAQRGGWAEPSVGFTPQDDTQKYMYNEFVGQYNKALRQVSEMFAQNRKDLAEIEASGILLSPGLLKAIAYSKEALKLNYREPYPAS